MYLGRWEIDDVLTFYANTTRSDTGTATDADAVPAYRVYEDETTTPILTGTMALLDSANTAGFYSEQITLSAANGFENGKQYSIYVSAAVNSITGAMHHTFNVESHLIPKKNEALSDIEFLMVDGTDFATPETGLTVSGTRSIDGGAFAAVSGTIAEVGNGIYQFDAAAADMNGSIITFRFTATGAAATFITLRTRI